MLGASFDLKLGLYASTDARSDLVDVGMIVGSIFDEAAVALHYGICSLCVIGASYRWAIKKRWIKLSCGLDIIVRRARCGPRALSLTHVLYVVWGGRARQGGGHFPLTSASEWKARTLG